jgi:hypothetical protein
MYSISPVILPSFVVCGGSCDSEHLTIPAIRPIERVAGVEQAVLDVNRAADHRPSTSA